MARKKTPSFIVEVPLATTWQDERMLRVNMEKAKDLYNAVLDMALRRCDAMKADPRWTMAREMPKATKDERKARGEAFREISIHHGFTWVELIKYGQRTRDACSIGDHLRGHDTQTIALRAFRAVEQFCYGRRGRPSFKKRWVSWSGRKSLNSIEGQESKSTIRVRNGFVHYNGHAMRLLLEPKSVWQTEALENPIKYTRIIRREVKGRWRWYAQIVVVGKPPIMTPVGNDVIGIDLGPTTIATTGDGFAKKERFCEFVVKPNAEIRRIERAMDRSRRATNPDCFDEETKEFKKGSKIKVRSKGYLRKAQKRRERERKLAAGRKCAHGQMANKVIAKGNRVKLEKLSYRSFQKSFGRSVQARAPAMFVSMLIRKAENAGGSVLLINTWRTKLSQFDHTTKDYVKKLLSERKHVFRDGVTPPLDRDLYPSWLARHCSDENTLDVESVMRDWPRAELLLRQAGVEWEQSTSTAATGQRHARRRRKKAKSRQSRSLADVRLAGERSPTGEDHSCGSTPSSRLVRAEKIIPEAAPIVTTRKAA